uniref:Uncharacterized protein n=1 Tax=Moniliophthora roreri TaxID=221103 RepID=A0A0W0F7L2_MONRR
MPLEPRSLSLLVLNRGDAERDRLNQQFWFYKNYHGRKVILDATINIPSDDTVLDAATGTVAWSSPSPRNFPRLSSRHPPCRQPRTNSLAFLRNTAQRPLHWNEN